LPLCGHSNRHGADWPGYVEKARSLEEGFPPCGSRDIRVGMNMKITEVRIYPTNEDLVKAYATISFDNCFLVQEIRVIKGPTGLFVSFPAKKQGTGPIGILLFRPTLKRE
jgi:SpoVG